MSDATHCPLSTRTLAYKDKRFLPQIQSLASTSHDIILLNSIFLQ